MQLLLGVCLLLAVAAHGTSAINLSKYLKPKIAQAKTWLARSPSALLDNYLTDSTGSRGLSDNMNVLVNLIHDESTSKRNAHLWEAAELMSRLRGIRDGFCDSTPAKTAEALESVRELLARDLGARFATDSSSSSRRVVRLYNEALRTHVRSCLAKYQQDWAQVDVHADVLGSDPVADRTLDKLYEEFKELMCRHAYKGGRLSINAFECSLQKADETLADKHSAWDVFQTLEAVQLVRDDKQAGENLQKLYEAKETQEIGQLVENSLGQSCQKLIDNKRVQATLVHVRQVVSLVPVLADELFPELSSSTDRLLEWTSRVIVCKRLLEKTDRERLNAEVLEWVESHRVRASAGEPANETGS